MDQSSSPNNRELKLRWRQRQRRRHWLTEEKNSRTARAARTLVEFFDVIFNDNVNIQQ